MEVQEVTVEPSEGAVVVSRVLIGILTLENSVTVNMYSVYLYISCFCQYVAVIR